jgi:hypothetical protein
VSITPLPPLSVPPDDGGSYYVCNSYEWAAATLKRGDACFFRKGNLPWRRGTYLSSYMYDGIIARVYEDDPDEFIEYSLFLDLGDRLILPEDREILRQWENLPR